MTTDITELALLVSKAKASVFTLEYISQFEPADIDSDDVDLRFEVDGRETGTNVSIVDECGQAAKVIGALVEALEKAQQLATQQGNIACALFDEVTAQRQRIAELESRTVNIKFAPIHVEELGNVRDGKKHPYMFGAGYNSAVIHCESVIQQELDAKGIKWEAE